MKPSNLNSHPHTFPYINIDQESDDMSKVSIIGYIHGLHLEHTQMVVEQLILDLFGFRTIGFFGKIYIFKHQVLDFSISLEQ